MNWMYQVTPEGSATRLGLQQPPVWTATIAMVLAPVHQRCTTWWTWSWMHF